jgi:hypothetical protein
LKAAPLKLILESRLCGDEPVGSELDRIEQFHDPAELGEVVKRLIQKDEQVNVTGRAGLTASHRAVQNQAAELRAVVLL